MSAGVGIAEAVERYLCPSEYETDHPTWSGNIWDRASKGHNDQRSCLHSGWDLANLYLSSVDAELLGPEAPSLLGLSQETTCCVSADYVERADIAREACEARNGWKVILRRCAPPQRRHQRQPAATEVA
ncbi:MAG: hypothetical protein ACREJ3_05435 [Polyangiaceae bacterium]